MRVAKSDLYELLGVARDAAPSDIRKAYREMSKKAHPDGGGSAEQFALVKTAVDVLTDDERRASYDRAGSFEETEVDQTFAQAMNMAIGAVQTVIQTIEQNGSNPANYDVLKDAVRKIEGERSRAESNIGAAKMRAAGLRALAKRFHVKSGKVDRIGPMIIAQATEIERECAKVRANCDVMTMAVGFLNDHEFDRSEPTLAENMRRASGGYSISSMNEWR